MYFDPTRLFELGAKMYTANKNEWPEKMVFVHSIDEKFNFTIPDRNGIWVKFYDFWCKYDGAKWSRKMFFKFFHEEAIFF